MRKLFSTLVLVVTLSSVAACSRSENSVTGLPGGTRTLAGEVVPVGDLAGASPAGITVSTNGQIATTDGVGQFNFVALPDRNVTLAFSRADGISATATVGANTAAVLVQLQKAKAAVVSTRMAKKEIEGLIEQISADLITVDDASTHGPVTAAITPTTVIRKGNRTLTTADLEVGDRVHVRAAINPDGTLTALEIKLQNEADDDDGGDEGGQLKELEGQILEISAESITVNNASTHGPVTATITPQTVIRKGNTRLTTNDLKVGNRVHVKTNGVADALVALQIMLQN